MENDFVLDSEKIVKLLETMALRGAMKPIKSKHVYSSDDIKVSDDEKKEIRLYTIKHRSILSKSGIKTIPSFLGEGTTTTCPTTTKLMYLSNDETSSEYCLILIEEITIAVEDYIKTVIEY